MRRGKRERVCAWRNFPIAYEFESFVRRRRRLNNRVCPAREFRTHRSLGMGTCIRVLGGILGKFESLPTPSETRRRRRRRLLYYSARFRSIKYVG